MVKDNYPATNDFADLLQEHLLKGLPDQLNFDDQRDFVLFMDITRRLAWDIPSALSTICHHYDIDIYPMHGPIRDTTITDHFVNDHNADLTNNQINWDFDT